MRGTAGCLSFHSYEQKHSLVFLQDCAIQPFKNYIYQLLLQLETSTWHNFGQ